MHMEAIYRKGISSFRRAINAYVEEEELCKYE